MPVGGTISTIHAGDSNVVLSCDAEEPSGWYREMYEFTTPSNIQHVYKTNVEGIGVSVGYAPNDSYWSYPATFYPLESVAASIGSYDVTFVKTGDIKSGVIDGGVLARIYGNGDMVTALAYQLPSTTATQIACSITTPKMTFPLGNIPASEFGNTVGFTPAESNTQNLGLECDAGANINVTLNGDQNPDTSETSVVALSGQGEPGIATGLGVQFIYDGKPLEINSRVVMKQSQGGQEILPITARYYQTKSVVTPGDASAYATLTLTYQ